MVGALLAVLLATGSDTGVAQEQVTEIAGAVAVTAGAAATPELSPTPGLTPMPELTPTPAPEEVFFPAGSRNADWTPIVQKFDGIPYVYVPAGCFLMGSDGFRTERPVHEVCLSAFWIGQTEVTNAQYGSSGRWSGDNHPREEVTWFEARDFCERRGARLPTEAEWEYAARGPEGWEYPWGNEFVAENAVYYENSGGQTADVGSRPGGASWVGAQDMSGNVWEWVSSIFEPYPYNAADGRESSTDTNSLRVLRGGLRGDSIDVLPAARRLGANPDGAGPLGFRCALPTPQ
jgi:iron(II)-dependent oxidoreductase